MYNNVKLLIRLLDERAISHTVYDHDSKYWLIDLEGGSITRDTKISELWWLDLPITDTGVRRIFDSTGDAYDYCMCRDDISTGDVLIIPNEKVVGLAYTWPISVTKVHGALHSMDGCKPISVIDEMPEAGIKDAFDVARALGWAI